MELHTSKHVQLIVKQFTIKKFMFQNIFLTCGHEVLFINLNFKLSNHQKKTQFEHTMKGVKGMVGIIYQINSNCLNYFKQVGLLSHGTCSYTKRKTIICKQVLQLKSVICN